MKRNEMVHPGEILKRNLGAISMSPREFSKRTGISEKQISLLLSGGANVTFEIAERLGKFFDQTSAYWTSLQTIYEEAKKQDEEERSIEEDFRLLSGIDAKWRTKYFPNFTRGNKRSSVAEGRRVLQASALTNLVSPNLFVTYKELRSKNKADPFLQNVWLSLAIKQAKTSEPLNYNEDLFKGIMARVKTLSNEEPLTFYPKLVSAFRKAGVYFAVVPYLAKTGIFGASCWIEKEGKKYPMIALSNRGQMADVFWFSLCHEAAHVLMRHTKNLMMNSDDTRNNPIEDEADRVGKAMIIGQEDWERFTRLGGGRHTKEGVVKFSKRQGVDPCVVAGWICHDDQSKRIYYQSLMKKYDFSELV